LTAGPALELVKVAEPGRDPEVVGRVDDGLDPQRAAVLEVLLDQGLLVERVDRHRGGLRAERRVPTDGSLADRGLFRRPAGC
jgi:hypothetical protein